MTVRHLVSITHITKGERQREGEKKRTAARQCGEKGSASPVAGGTKKGSSSGSECKMGTPQGMKEGRSRVERGGGCALMLKYPRRLSKVGKARENELTSTVWGEIDGGERLRGQQEIRKRRIQENRQTRPR